MPKDTKEPQSYGSGSDWVAGRTGEHVNDPKAEPPPQHEDFYDERRESETSGSTQGGLTSDVQLADNAEADGNAAGDHSPIPKVTTQSGGAKRGSFFRKRDYE